MYRLFTEKERYVSQPSLPGRCPQGHDEMPFVLSFLLTLQNEFVSGVLDNTGKFLYCLTLHTLRAKMRKEQPSGIIPLPMESSGHQELQQTHKDLDDEENPHYRTHLSRKLCAGLQDLCTQKSFKRRREEI